jgi:hypothetical protein
MLANRFLDVATVEEVLREMRLRMPWRDVRQVSLGCSLPNSLSIHAMCLHTTMHSDGSAGTRQNLVGDVLCRCCSTTRHGKKWRIALGCLAVVLESIPYAT